MTVTSLGRPAHFLVPARKWGEFYDVHEDKFKSLEKVVHEFLVANYGGYTIRGPFHGVWKPTTGILPNREPVIEIKVSFEGKNRIPKLQEFLASLCTLIGEECIYLETGEDSWLVYP